MWLLLPSFFSLPYLSNECTYVPRREDYSSSLIPLQRAICRDRGELGSETRSIILDHVYWITAAHSASPNHPRAILGHSRDFHSSGERSTHAPRNLEKLLRSSRIHKSPCNFIANFRSVKLVNSISFPKNYDKEFINLKNKLITLLYPVKYISLYDFIIVYD